jgi:hypothetical protein
MTHPTNADYANMHDRNAAWLAEQSAKGYRAVYYTARMILEESIASDYRAMAKREENYGQRT